MPIPRNPFKPTAGATPPLLVGRDEVLERFAEALDDGPGAPGRLTLITGARGVGKTVMLTELARHALPGGWLTISETATPGLLARLDALVEIALREVGPDSSPGRSLTGVTLPVVGGGVTWSERPAATVRWRERVGALLDAIAQRGAGLIITVDEVHAAGREDLRDLAATFQHLVREERDIVLVAAGLPAAVSDLLNDDVLTFLRRAERVVLDDVPLDEVREALRTTITASGRTIDDDALALATEATGGYPFMIQLVGYHVWRRAVQGHINYLSTWNGVDDARKRLGSTVHETALADLSAVDRTYLLAMSQDDGRSSTSIVASRIGVGPEYGNVYRTRLIDAGVIVPTGRGYVDFAIPHLRRYLREHAASIEMASRQAGWRRT